MTLSLIHPALYRTGLDVLHKLRELDSTKVIAREWQSVYTGISPICNRRTPFHRDSKGRPEWFDMLSSYSDSSTSPRLLIEDLGLNLEYSSGTVVGFCGQVFKHGVESWGVGNRICYAHFMRESIRERLDGCPAGWVYRNQYLPAVVDIVMDTEKLDEDAMDL